MSLKNRPRYLLEALAVHEALRRLGFSNEQLHLLLSGPDGEVSVHVHLMPSGDTRPFLVDTSSMVNRTKKEVAAEWEEVAEEWNKNSTKVERDQIWNDSWVKKNSVALLLSLKARDITWPSLLKNLN